MDVYFPLSTLSSEYINLVGYGEGLFADNKSIEISIDSTPIVGGKEMDNRDSIGNDQKIEGGIDLKEHIGSIVAGDIMTGVIVSVHGDAPIDNIILRFSGKRCPDLIVTDNTGIFRGVITPI